MSFPTKNEEDSQLNRQGYVVGRSGEEGIYGGGGGCKYRLMGHDSVLIFKMYKPRCACLLNSSIINALCIIRILPNPDRNLGSIAVRIKPVHLYVHRHCLYLANFFQLSQCLCTDISC